MAPRFPFHNLEPAFCPGLFDGLLLVPDIARLRPLIQMELFWREFASLEEAE